MRIVRGLLLLATIGLVIYVVETGTKAPPPAAPAAAIEQDPPLVEARKVVAEWRASAGSDYPQRLARVPLARIVAAQERVSRVPASDPDFAAARAQAAALQAIRDEIWTRAPRVSGPGSTPGDRLPAIDGIRVVDYRWRKGGFGVVGIVTLTVANDNSYAVKDPVVRCVFTGESGTRLSEPAQTVYQIVPARGRKTLKNIAVGWIDSQSARASCAVIAVERAN